MWNPQQYLQFQAERDRPFFDLLAQVPGQPQTVADLGCGTGHLTAALAQRWPQAAVVGIDSSAEMLERARPYASAQLTFEQADLQSWRPERPLDVLISNAALQWVPDHAALIPRLAGLLSPGGTLAFQVPGNFGAPSHTLVAEVLARPRWAALSEGRDKPALGSFGPAEYTDLLAPLGRRQRLGNDLPAPAAQSAAGRQRGAGLGQGHGAQAGAGAAQRARRRRLPGRVRRGTRAGVSGAQLRHAA